MDHPQELSLLVTHLEALFNILENQYIQLAGLPLIERNQTSALRDKLKSQMKDIVLVLEQLNECYSAGKKVVTQISRELDIHLPTIPTVLYTPTPGFAVNADRIFSKK